MNTTQAYLLEKFGPLMSLDALAKVLDRAPQGLRVSLNTNSDLANVINESKKKIGRRVYFRTEKIAQFLDEE